MKHKSLENLCHFIISTFVIYTLIFTLIIPAQILAETIRDNSVFNKNFEETKQNDNSKMDKSFGNSSGLF